ncbi:MAG: hypothetical protein AAGJ18_27855, partial [Bacteroidota bacterium]
LLGASVLEDVRGNIRQKLYDTLKTHFPDKGVEVINFSQPGQTSKDSANKLKMYQQLAQADLVLFYHAINESKANACPDSIFDIDYNHYARIQKINTIIKHWEANYTVIPLYLELLGQRINPPMSLEKYYSTKGLGDKWLNYGEHIKTRASFEKNLTAIHQQCQQNQVSLLSPEYVYYLPEDYKKANHQQYYTEGQFGRTAVELWGIPKFVKKGIDAHNAVNEKVASKYDFSFVKTNDTIPKVKANFNDICHLTNRGASVFVAVIAPEIIEIMQTSSQH